VVDFLLPHGNWTRRPPGRDASPRAPYGRWLAGVFDDWYGTPQRTRIRLFGEIMHLVLGAPSRSEQVGLSPAAMVVFSVDGAIEQVDALRSAYPGAASTAMSVFRNDLDEVLAHPSIIARQIGMAALSDECVRCPLVPICGAGHYAHRYRQGSGFRNPSVYCPDLAYLIRHIAGRVRTDIDRLRESVR
jgi:uncharacterized protein